MFDVYCEAKKYNQDNRVKDLYLKGLLEARHRVILEEENEYNLLKRAYEQGSFDAQRGIGFGFQDWYDCIQYCENPNCGNGYYCEKSLKL